jgi:integrase
METEKQNEKPKRERGTGYVFERPGSKSLWLQYYVRGERVRISAKTDNWNKAKRELRKRTGQAVAGVHADTSRATYEDLRAEYYLDYQTNKHKSLRFDREGKPHLDKVARLDEYFAGYEAAQITTETVRAYILDQQGKGLSNGSINRSLTALKRMLNLKREANPHFVVPKIKMLEEAAPRSGHLTYEQYIALRDAMPEYLRIPLAIGFFTGMRHGEVTGLRWSQMDLLEDLITLEPGTTKNNAGRTAPICAELRTLLVAHRKAAVKAGCEWVCFRIDKKTGRAVQAKGFRKAWYSSCVRAGLGHWQPVVDDKGQPLFQKPRGPRSKPKQKMEWVGLIFHDLRRSATIELIDAGVPEDTAMKIGGWKTKSMLTRYNIQTTKRVKTAGQMQDQHNALRAKQIAEAAANSHSLATVDGVSGASETVN